ncbi:DNA-3-methyladenine glycosylase II [Fodinibius roseus]|uniref:DNA-3-methyladenine glycosylase II n=1 Tax=Fodinibius roseus TaxID=1194090 RepID=A0A1M4YX86_9BACT|nr:DNA-3-methyladenine glycosylase [Fodinibius roseus]SHF10434.1 DNA-3-methyladenine glycosylase II [Fodinibius roseus]
MEFHHDTAQLNTPHIFNFAECLHFLDRGYDDCLYTIEGKAVLKPLRIGKEQGLIKISPRSDTLKVERIAGELNLTKATQYVTEWFDLKRELQPFYQLLDQHEQFSWMSTRYHGLRLMGIPDLFEALCWCVIGQQINLTFAYKLKRRLVENYGSFLKHDSTKHYFFPEPEVLAALSVESLRDMQFSRRKAEYIIGIARQFVRGDFSKQQLQNQETYQQMVTQLKTIRGVGDWTANYVLMKSLQKMNCITYGDTGLQSAVSSIMNLDRKPTRSEIENFFKPFRGWESYLNIYLWRKLS